MSRLVVSPRAQADIDEILEYLKRNAGRFVALRYGERFRDSLALLMEFPA